MLCFTWKSDHILLSFKIAFECYNIDEQAPTLNHNKADYTAISQALDDLDWHQKLDGKTIQECYDIFVLRLFLKPNWTS